MMAKGGVNIHRMGLVTAVGMGAAQTFSSVKAGVAGFKESSVHNSRFEPVVMATLPENALPALADEIEKVTGLTNLQRRLLRLATPVLEEVLGELDPQGFTEQIPLFLATPEKHPELNEPISAEFLDHLATQVNSLGLSFNLGGSTLIPKGRAGGLMAMDQAMKFLESGRGDYVLAGGVDSFFDLMILATLDGDKRIQNSQVMDGFIPGEGAGILLLGRPGAPPVSGLEPIARLLGVGMGEEPGHRYSEEPYRGDGLADAFASLLADRSILREPVSTIYAGLNGESFGAKEYGVARLRSNKEILPDALVMHPADCFGDIGAATGPVMLGLAAMGIQANIHEPPGLVWCSSEGPERAAALVDGLST